MSSGETHGSVTAKAYHPVPAFSLEYWSTGEAALLMIRLGSESLAKPRCPSILCLNLLNQSCFVS